VDDPTTAQGVDAAVRAAARYGFPGVEPRLLSETNNVVVWLRPHPVVAKVGRWPDSGERLLLEHDVATVLAESDAPLVRPLRGLAPVTDEATGFIVTLWDRLDAVAGTAIDAVEHGKSLRGLHAHLARYDGELPGLRRDVDRARRALNDDGMTRALAPDDRDVLRRAIDSLLPRVDGVGAVERPLHGEPHGANLLATSAGPTWIDLENVCRGPIEWDLAFLPEEALAVFDEADPDLVESMRTLNSARTATWCWMRVDVGDMRWHAEHHLRAVRLALGA
jgi:hypothetical protein